MRSITYLLFITAFLSCQSDNKSKPTVTTAEITNVTANSATCGGNVASDGGELVTARGVCWDTIQNPTTSDDHTSDNIGVGSFVSAITGLHASTQYYARAYARNSEGTAYGNEVGFITGPLTGTFTDTRDGHAYKWVQIGTQTWMAENLDYRTADSSWYYGFDSTTYHIYGRLYSWNRAMIAAPPGWHLPTDDEWVILTTYLGENFAGDKLRDTGSTYWVGGLNANATNESGFTALPGGRRNDQYPASFDGLGSFGYWWSATEYLTPTLSWCRSMRAVDHYVNRLLYDKVSGFSIRCVKN